MPGTPTAALIEAAGAYIGHDVAIGESCRTARLSLAVVHGHDLFGDVLHLGLCHLERLEPRASSRVRWKGVLRAAVLAQVLGRQKDRRRRHASRRVLRRRASEGGSGAQFPLRDGTVSHSQGRRAAAACSAMVVRRLSLMKFHATCAKSREPLMLLT